MAKMTDQEQEQYIEMHARVLFRRILAGNRNWWAITDGNKLMESWSRYALDWLIRREYVFAPDTLLGVYECALYLSTDAGREWWREVLNEAGISTL